MYCTIEILLLYKEFRPWMRQGIICSSKRNKPNNEIEQINTNEQSHFYQGIRIYFNKFQPL